MTKEIARELWPEVYGAVREEARTAAVCMKAAMFMVVGPNGFKPAGSLGKPGLFQRDFSARRPGDRGCRALRSRLSYVAKLHLN